MPQKRICPRRFLRDTAHMSLERRGLVATLLCHLLERGSLPRTMEEKARLCGAFPDEFRSHWDEIEAVVLPQDEPDTPKRPKRKQGLDPDKVAAVELGAIRKREGNLLSPEERKVVIDEVLCRYIDFHEKARPGEKERKRIAARLCEGFSLDDLLMAIEGNHASPFHCGENADGKKYHSLELIFRNADKVTSFIEMGREKGPGKLSQRERDVMGSIDSLVEMEFGDGF